MIIENIPKSLAELYKSLLSELKPNWKVEIIIEDYNLYKLGFVDESPCSLKLDASKEDISELYDEIIDMESSVYLYEDLLYKNPLNMSEEETREYRALKKREKEYDKYAPLEAISSYWLQQKS